MTRFVQEQVQPQSTMVTDISLTTDVTGLDALAAEPPVPDDPVVSSGGGSDDGSGGDDGGCTSSARPAAPVWFVLGLGLIAMAQRRRQAWERAPR